MTTIYEWLNTFYRWLSTDPTPEQRSSEIATKTQVGQWAGMSPQKRRETARFFGTDNGCANRRLKEEK